MAKEKNRNSAQEGRLGAESFRLNPDETLTIDNDELIRLMQEKLKESYSGITRQKKEVDE